MNRGKTLYLASLLIIFITTHTEALPSALLTSFIQFCVHKETEGVQAADHGGGGDQDGSDVPQHKHGDSGGTFHKTADLFFEKKNISYLRT